uniref:Uncharacterized protein n=1 Tax=Rhizophora mucronata TaxID=61149 RepID=A0A2P2LAL2_RHIMU
MLVGLKPTLKLDFPVYSHFATNSPSCIFSSFASGSKASINLTRLSFLSGTSEEGHYLCRNSLKMRAYLSAMQTNDCSQMEVAKINLSRRSHSGLNRVIPNAEVTVKEENFAMHGSLGESRTSQFSLLLKNLNILEESFADSEVLKLERDILLQLERLGGLKFFKNCLSRAVKTSHVSELSYISTEKIGEGDQVGELIVSTGKKEERKLRRESASSKRGTKSTFTSLNLETVRKSPRKPNFSSTKEESNSRSRRLSIARNEAELSKGIKVVAELEKIRSTLEDETGQVANLGCWAAAAGLDKKGLQQRLCFGWYCRDELLSSTRSLVLYLARNYRGLGIAGEDLLQVC